MSIRRAAHLAWRQIGDETVVVDIRGKRALWLNRAASRIWHSLNEATAPGSALGPGKGSPDPSRGRFLAELHDLGLLTGDAPGSDVRGADSWEDEPSVGEPPAVVWVEPLERFAGGCGRTPQDLGIPDCMTSPNLS